MPGICGIITKQPDADTPTQVEAMVARMRHESFYRSGTCDQRGLNLSVGWTCLPDSFSDCLPAWNEAKSIGLFFSGECGVSGGASARLLRQGLGAEPDIARDLIPLYEGMGDKFLETLNGWFSGVLVDLREGKVVLFNDRFGFSRVYWHENRDGFYFASEAKALLKILPETRQLDPVGLAQMMSCGCALRNRTLFQGIQLLPGAATWTFQPGRGVRRETYFKPEQWENQPTLGPAEFHERLRETFSRALPRYFHGRRLVGMSLTGGLDGRMIMAHASRAPSSLPCYTFGGMFRDCLDVRLARRVATVCGQPHQVIPVDREFISDFPALAEQAVCVSDGAMDVTGAAELFANRRAREIAPVRLTGNYGSEVLRGVVAFKPDASLSDVFNPAFASQVEAAAATYAQEATGHPLSFIAFKQVPWHHYSRLSVEQSQLTLRSPFLDNKLVSLIYQAPLELAASREPSFQLIRAGNPALSRIETDRGLLHRPVPVLTRARHLWREFTFRAEYAYDYGMPQSVARVDGALRPLHLERLFLGRHKFCHFRLWYRDEWKGYLEDMLLGPNTRCRRFFRDGQIQAILAGHRSGRQNHTTQIHRMLTLEIILRRLLEEH